MTADCMSSDRIRNEIFSSKTYSEKEKLSVYDEMLKRMGKLLRQNKNLIIDATFYRNKIREKFIREAGKVFFIEIKADEQTIKERVKKKRMDSEADFEVHKKIKKQWEPMDEPHLVLQSTNDNIEDMLHNALEHLHINNDKRTNK